MRKSRIIQVVLAGALLTAMPLLMGAGPDLDPAKEPGGTTGEVLLPDRPVQQTIVSPQMQEIKDAMATSDEVLAGLQQQLKVAPDETEALRLLRAIHQHKQDTEISILRIQERFARQAGDAETADKISQAVDEILNPPAPAPNAQARAESEARHSGGSHHE